MSSNWDDSGYPEYNGDDVYQGGSDESDSSSSSSSGSSSSSESDDDEQELATEDSATKNKPVNSTFNETRFRSTTLGQYFEKHGMSPPRFDDDDENSVLNRVQNNDFNQSSSILSVSLAEAPETISEATLSQRLIPPLCACQKESKK